MAKQRAKAICLISGGVDSSLAALLLKEQGIEVIGLNFILPFEEIFKLRAETAARRIARYLGIELRVMTMDEDYIELLRNPPHGYGSQVNPCIDCHIYMFRKAKVLMEREAADFVATGEVLGQRPMSQRTDTLRLIEKESGLQGYLLRPLSALLLEPTVPEKEGIVERAKLLAMRGRSRKEILAIARAKGLKDFSSPAGGCLFTDPGFAKRVRDLIDHDALSLKELRRLAIGRHLRLPAGSKLIVGRNQQENEIIARLVDRDEFLLRTVSVPGPTAILADTNADELDIASAIVARYSDALEGERVEIEVSKAGQSYKVTSLPLARDDVSRLVI